MLISDLFLGAGAMKCGTTWLYHVMKQHPHVYFSQEKEIHYFAHRQGTDITLNAKTRLQRTRQAMSNIRPDAESTEPARQRLMWYTNYLSDPVDDRWYANLFSFRGRRRYSADFSNLYCHLNDDGWSHVKSVAQNVRVLFLVRNPIDRLWSHIRFHLTLTGRFAEIKGWNETDYLEFAKKPYIWKNGEYSKAIATMRRNLSAQQLRVEFFEDVHANRKSWISGLEDFLGIPHLAFTDATLEHRVNESPSIPMPEFFPRLFKPYCDAEYLALKASGLDPDGRWRAANEIAV